MQIQIDALFFPVADEIKPVHAHDDRIFFKRVRRAVRNVADKFFFADGHGVSKSFGDKNFFAADVRREVFDNRIDNRGENFLRVELQAAVKIFRESFAVANVVHDTFGRGHAIEHGVGERNFFVGRDVCEFALEFVERNFFGGSQSLQKFRRRGFMIAVGKLAHFVYRRAQIIGVRLERQPQRFESVEDARQLFEPVLCDVS